MNEQIKPYIIDMSSESVFPATLENPRKWAVDLEVKIGNQQIADEYKSLNRVKKFLARHTVNKFLNRLDGSLGLPLYLLVCSTDYVNEHDPQLHSEEDIHKALIQEASYDEAAAKKYVTDHINAIQAGNFDDISRQLEPYFDLSPWFDD